MQAKIKHFVQCASVSSKRETMRTQKDGNQQVNLNALSRGLYILNIDRKNQPYFQAKVMKE